MLSPVQKSRRARPKIRMEIAGNSCVQGEATVRRPTNDDDGCERQQPVESAASWTSRVPSFDIASSLSPLWYVVGFSLIALPSRHKHERLLAIDVRTGLKRR